MRRILLSGLCLCLAAGTAQAAAPRHAASPPSGLPTPERLLKMWENAGGGDVASQALDRAFPNEMRHIAEAVLAKVRAGGSAEQAMADANKARTDLVRENLWLARMAPDENLLAYADVIAGLMRGEQAQHPGACAAIGLGGATTRTVGKPVQRIIAEQVALIEAGRAHPVRRAERSAADYAATLKAAVTHGASQSDVGDFASGALESRPEANQCRMTLAFVSSVRDLPAPAAGRMVAAMLGDSQPAANRRLASTQDMVEELKQSPNLGPAISLLATEMPEAVNALAAAANERLKAGDVEGSDQKIDDSFIQLLADNIDAVVGAPTEKLLAVQRAILAANETAMAAAPRCGVDPAQVAGLPSAKAYQEANAALLRALVDAMLSGRRALAAAGMASPLTLEPTQEDKRVLAEQIKRTSRDPVASQAVLDGSLGRQPPAVVCSANTQVARAVLALPVDAEARLIAAFLRDSYGPKPH